MKKDKDVKMPALFDVEIKDTDEIKAIVGAAEVDAESGVRPIFCIEGDTKVYQQQLEKIGVGYVIEK